MSGSRGGVSYRGGRGGLDDTGGVGSGNTLPFGPGVVQVNAAGVGSVFVGTSGRIPYMTSGNLLQDSDSLKFATVDGSTLTVGTATFLEQNGTGLTITGGTAASEIMTLVSTSHATKGKIVASDALVTPAGAVGAPGHLIGTASELNGWYRVSAARVGLAIAGVATATFGTGNGDYVYSLGAFQATDQSNASRPEFASASDSRYGMRVTGALVALSVAAVRAIECDYVGSVVRVGMYTGTPVVQGAVGATLTNNVTAGGTTNQVDDVVAAPVDVNASSLVSTRNAVYQLTLKLATIEAKLKLLGAVKT